MNLLFDFISVRVKTGAGEYQRRILFELLRFAARYAKHVVWYPLC